MKRFDKDIIGVTGRSNDDEEFKEILKKFRVYSTKLKYEIEDESALSEKEKLKAKDLYTIDHTVLTYLMDDNNNYVYHVGSLKESPEEEARILIEKMLANEQLKKEGEYWIYILIEILT